MFNTLDQICSYFNISFDDEEIKYEDMIINIFNNKVYYLSEVNEPIVLNLIANYYNLKKDYKLMMIYYLTAIQKGCHKSMWNLGHYYQYIEKNYDKMKKYYLMAIEKGNRDAMVNLGVYYQYMEKNYDEMKKYGDI